MTIVAGLGRYCVQTHIQNKIPKIQWALGTPMDLSAFFNLGRHPSWHAQRRLTRKKFKTEVSWKGIKREINMKQKRRKNENVKLYF